VPWAKLLDCAGLLALYYPALYYSRAGSKLSATANLPILNRKTEFTMAVVPNTMDIGSIGSESCDCLEHKQS
jgi:hypothetical protein